MRHKRSSGNWWRGVIQGLLVLVVMLIQKDVTAQSARLKVRGQVQYVHGVNVGWMFGRYGTDIGYDPLKGPHTAGYNSIQASNWLTDLKRMNINVVRLWMFEGLEGLEFDNSGCVSKLQPIFLQNMNDLMTRANALGLSFELVLTTHNAHLEFGKKLPTGAVVKNYVKDATARQKFIVNAVAPLAQAFKNNAALFSIDLMNESDLGVLNGVCTQAELRTFVAQTTTAIHGASPAIQVTCSSAWYKYTSAAEHGSWYGGLGLDYYECHNYSSTPNLPTVPSWLDKPLLLGEYGPSLPASAGYTGRLWTEAEQNSATTAYLNQARTRGWAGTLAWIYYHSPGNGESLVRTPGAVQDWESAAVTIRDFGATLAKPATVLPVYRDRLETDWSNWSWGCTVNTGSIANIYAGTTAVRLNSTAAWSGFSLRKGTAISLTPYSKIRFAIYTPGATRSFQLFTQSSDTGAASPVRVFSTLAGRWTTIEVPLTALGSPTLLKRITIQSLSSGPIGIHDVDSIELVP